MKKKQGPTLEQIMKVANEDGCAAWAYDLIKAIEKNDKLEADLREAIHYIIGLRSPEMLGSTDMESFKKKSIAFTDRIHRIDKIKPCQKGSK